MIIRDRYPQIPFEPDPWYDSTELTLGFELGIWWGQMYAPYETFNDYVSQENKYKVFAMARHPNVRRQLLKVEKVNDNVEKLTFGPKGSDKISKGEEDEE